MKKGIFTFGLVLASACAMAQSESPPPPPPPQQPTTLTVDQMKFKEDVHDFGTIAEGKPAEFEFRFRNTGKEPILISDVRPACSCTTPNWTKEPVLPGKTGVVKAFYGTQGRPGHFDKTVTVVSNAGTKVLTIKGTVQGSAPAATGHEGHNHDGHNHEGHSH